MPCNHKFQEYLNLQKLDFEPTTLIVGTFNPAIEGNEAEWFYGRTANNYFWEVLPKLYNEQSLIGASPKEWKQFCNRNRIAITDLITSIDDADMNNPLHLLHLKNYSDTKIAKEFKKHTLVKIEELLQNNSSIRAVYLTRGTSGSFWKKLWKPIAEYATKHTIKATTLLTPSGYAFYQLGKYNKQNPLNPLKLEDYILWEWKNKWHI